MATPNESPVRMLFNFYFVPCDLMQQHVIRLKDLDFSDPEIEKKFGHEYLAFTLYWLASLFVVAEGWKELKLSDSEVDKMIDEHWDSLRRFRNAVFHFQPDDRKHKQFRELDKFNWAAKLHASLQAFFTAQGG